MTRRSTLALPAVGCVWASACTSARDSSAGTRQSNMTDFHPRTCPMPFPPSCQYNALSAQHWHALPSHTCQALRNTPTSPGYHFSPEFVTQGFVAGEMCALCVSSPNNVKYEFSCMLTEESCKLTPIGT